MSKRALTSGALAVQALFCQVTPRHVLNMCDVSNIWHVPIMLEAQGAHKSICDILQIGGHDSMDLTGMVPDLEQSCTKPLRTNSLHMQEGAEAAGPAFGIACGSVMSQAYLRWKQAFSFTVYRVADKAGREVGLSERCGEDSYGWQVHRPLRCLPQCTEGSAACLPLRQPQAGGAVG